MKTLGLVAGLAALCTLPACAKATDAPRGAVVPWDTYEAELAKTNGRVIGPDYSGQTPAREASGRRYVQLEATGDSLEFVAKHDAEGLVVRYSLADPSPDVTLSLLINGRRTNKLAMTSKYSHLYGAYPFSNDRADGSPRNFWDETRLMPGPIRAGDVLRIEKGNDDAASEYLIDFIELEPVAPALEKPPGALSVIDFGAIPDDMADDRPALLAAIAASKAQHKPIWIPAGKFLVNGTIELSDVTLQGAGMWHTTLIGADDYSKDHRVALIGTGPNVTLSDFAITGKLDYRNDNEPNDGIGGSFGTGSTLRNLWIEHTKAGAWLTNSDGLLIEGCRFRNTIADGINLCLGMRDTTVRNCTARGTGDDCFAMWPATYQKSAYSHGSNQFIRCTAQLPFLAQGFSIYGGDGNSVVDCQAIDIPYGAGLFASTTFPSETGFQGTTIFQRNQVLRAGDREGAVGTVANQTDLVGLHLQDIDIIDSPNDAIRFMSVNGRALRGTAVDRVVIRNAGIAGSGHGIVSADDARGSVTLSHIVIENAKSGAFRNVALGFEVRWGDGTSALREIKQSSVAPSEAAER